MSLYLRYEENEVLWIMAPGSVITTLHFFRNLRMGTISKSVCNSQAFPAYCNVTLWLIGHILKIRRKWSFVNTDPDPIFFKFVWAEDRTQDLFVLPFIFSRITTELHIKMPFSSLYSFSLPTSAFSFIIFYFEKWKMSIMPQQFLCI